MTDSQMNFQDKAPKIPPRILCIGMPVRDLTFHTPGVPGRGSKENATAFDEICGGNALNGAIGIARLGGRASICGPMGDAKETSSHFIFEQMAHEGIDTKHLIHMPGLVTPISAVMIDPSGERTIVTFRDPELWHVKLPDFDTLLDDCAAILTESRCAEFCTELCAEAIRRGIPVIVHALSQFERSKQISEVITVLPAEETAGFESLAGKFGLTKASRAVAGGATRAQSVRNGLDQIASADIVAVHDGVRPFVTADEIDRVVLTAHKTGAAILTAAVADTIKRVEADRIVETIPRATLRRALTPQCFRFDILKRAYERLDELESNGIEITDDSLLVERLGVEIVSVEGGAQNIKITNEADLALAERILKSFS